ncbi:MAG TPA: type I-B CRISPR-associated protein Cas5b [Dictyoglomaceae bacterium]|nr:type I-B CRISPR-associated protein Cas5b [Dictyoglomaceae bacterium]HPU44083.1 type I-B CRISPR-associated protein Cas5b [Dictyoglomaceae bacterium]
MEVLVFDLLGKMAHFRKYYTNSSSLSYYFPPRTTITGILAGIIGLERDLYYEQFSEENCKIGISIKSSLRKKINMVNYIWAENLKDINLSKKQHTQIPLEIILPEDYKHLLIYRIFFAHKDEREFEKVKEKIVNEKVCFPPYLGISEFIGKINYVYLGKAEEKYFDNIVEINSVVNVEYIKNNECNVEPYENSLYIKELMPFSFDKNRQLRNSPKEFIGEIRNGKIKLKGHGKAYFIRELNENILFMEDEV